MHLRIEHGHSSFHRLAGQYQVGQEHLAGCVFFAHVIHADDESPIDGIEWIDALLDGLSCQTFCILDFAVDDALGHALKQFFVHDCLRCLMGDAFA